MRPFVMKTNSVSLSSIASKSAAVATATTTPTAHNPDAPSNINLTTVNTSDADSAQTCPHWDRTLTSHISLAGHMRIHCVETGELVPGTSNCARRIRFHCPHCPCILTQRMGLLGYMRNHEYGIHRSLELPSTSCQSSIPSPIHTPSPSAHHWHYYRRHRLRHCRSILPVLSSHIHLKNRPGRSFANSSYRDWETNAWNTNLHSLHSPPLSPHIRSSHRPIRTHAHSRKPAVDNHRLRHTITFPPTNTPHHTATSPTTSTQLPPSAQVGSVRLGPSSMQLLCCVCDLSLRLSRCAKRRGLEGCRLTPHRSPSSLPSCMCFYGVAETGCYCYFLQ
nr:unnamed protein product [Spirometra erinaceieuropaei]